MLWESEKAEFLYVWQTRQWNTDRFIKAKIARGAREEAGRTAVAGALSNCRMQIPRRDASDLFQIFSIIARLVMRRHNGLSVWGAVRHTRAHGQCGLSRTAGVMLNVRRSDRNANQVSKLTLHSHRCTSDPQWFISQSESMCHCVECSWVNTALAKVYHLAARPPPPPSTSHRAWTALCARGRR